MRRVLIALAVAALLVWLTASALASQGKGLVPSVQSLSIKPLDLH